MCAEELEYTNPALSAAVIQEATNDHNSLHTYAQYCMQYNDRQIWRR